MLLVLVPVFASVSPACRAEPFAQQGPRQARTAGHDWPQWGRTAHRNNVSPAKSLPSTWNVDERTNVKWSARLGSAAYGNPVVASGRVFVGTNNANGYVKRFPRDVDLGCLVCFDEKTGKFLWQHSVAKLKDDEQDWPQVGICDSPFCRGERLWYVTSRCEVVCLDAAGFQDGENDGPFKAEPNENRDEADLVWSFDIRSKLGVHPHNMSSCSVTCAGDVLLVNTSNGVGEDGGLPAPDAPSFLGLDAKTGKLLWKDASPGRNILHGQWSSPAFGVLAGKPQALFAGGDGWLYSFNPAGDGRGGAKLWWKFDCNPKDAKWDKGGRGRRNNVIATPVIANGRVYVATGQDPEHGEGEGDLWCIDPAKRTDGGDVSEYLVVDATGRPVAHRRVQALDKARGEKLVRNPRSAVVWHVASSDLNADGKIEFPEKFHRCLGSPAIAEGLLVIGDFGGLVHCIDATTGKRHWSYDAFSAIWGSPLIADGKVYIGDEDGDVAIFRLSRDRDVAVKKDGDESRPALGEISMNAAVYSTPIVAGGVLFVSTRSTLFAIGK